MVSTIVNTARAKMLRKNLLIAVIPAIFFSEILYAQEKEPSKLPSISAGAGVLIFNGDLGNQDDLSSYSRIRVGYHFGIEQRFGKLLGVSANGLIGKLAQSERSKTSNNNFESKIMQGDLSVMLHTDQFFQKANLTPYIGAGIGFLKFDPYGDLMDKNGQHYFYWSDGSIKNLPETTANIPVAQTIQRDYTYESQLKDSVVNYARNTLIVPLTLGFSFRMADNFEANLGATYTITFSDYIDNIKKGGNDTYLYTRFGLTYTFKRREKTGPGDKRYDKVDFTKLDEGDSDGDGIKDAKDNCPGTPKGVKVDADGCPADADKDGVPDYMDKESDSKKGAIVDANGVTLTDQILEKKQAEWEAASSQRSESFNANPTESNIKEIEKTATEVRTQTGAAKTLPPEFQGADFNKDNFIQVTEINQVIDGFFTGENDFTVERINRLIDFFFEQ